MIHTAHHWLVSMRGGERVAETILRTWGPEVSTSTLFLDRERLSPALQARRFLVSPLDRLRRWGIPHSRLLPLLPWATRHRSIAAPAGTRLLVTSDAAVIKGLRRPATCRHLCYCHSPPRYLWDLGLEYARRTSGLGQIGRAVFALTAPAVRRFDQDAARGVDQFVANSHFVAARIARCYGASAVVLHPPVELARFTWDRPREDFYLVVGELTAYKRPDLAVEACTRLGRTLIVIGDGPERLALARRAGPTVQFLGRLSDTAVADHLARCRALVHPQIEDFGITALEALASGAPVIAFGEGGATETVVAGVTGLYFRPQTAEALVDVLRSFEAHRPFPAHACRARAEAFAPETFERGWQSLVATWLSRSEPSPPRR